MKQITRIFSFLILIFISIWILPQCLRHKENNHIQSVITDIKSTYAPDKRVAIFDINIQESNNEIIVTGETSSIEAYNALQDSLNNFQTEVNFNVSLLPDSTVADKSFGIVNLSVINIRSKPGHSNELVSQSILGTPVRILKNKGYWNLIQTPDNYIGWADGTAILAVTKNDYNTWVNAKKVTYTKHFGFIWSSDKFEHSISDITAGSLLKLLNSSNNYYQVEFPDKRTGYIQKSTAEPFEQWMNNHSYSSEAIIKAAMPFFGHPYLWGGTSTKGVDCSGFTKTVYYLNGIVLQRDASQQELYGESISTENNFEELQAGDLLFFGKAETDSTKKRVTHVGIYIGDLSFIHSSGRVYIDSFNPEKENYNEYRRNTLVSVRRVLNSVNTLGIQRITDNNFYKIQN